jgi:hypothetical protein
MSQLDHLQTFGESNRLSALPRKRTSEPPIGMSALGRTSSSRLMGIDEVGTARTLVEHASKKRPGRVGKPRGVGSHVGTQRLPKVDIIAQATEVRFGPEAVIRSPRRRGRGSIAAR